MWIGFSLLDPIDESKEIIPKVNGGVGDDEGADTVLDEFVPSKDNIDLGKSENRGKWIGWGVENETFDRGALECRRAGKSPTTPRGFVRSESALDVSTRSC